MSPQLESKRLVQKNYFWKFLVRNPGLEGLFVSLSQRIADESPGGSTSLSGWSHSVSHEESSTGLIQGDYPLFHVAQRSPIESPGWRTSHRTLSGLKTTRANRGNFKPCQVNIWMLCGVTGVSVLSCVFSSA